MRRHAEAEKVRKNDSAPGEGSGAAESELSKRFDPSAYEPVWREYWEREGVFSRPSVGGAKSFSMVIPPPNVTGKLHMGHALNMTLQDVLLRFNFLRGRDALWVPGTDHAGIATQNVVEVKLDKEGLDRHKLGREKFVERVWAWKDEYHANIKNQITRMGAGVDWKRERFTLDEQCSLAVRTAFKQLFDEGLIYQDSRIINWCPFHKTALSDIEVEHVEEDGFFYHIKYPVKGEDYALEIATTRPETLLGDSAVAVHPDDERYKKYHGKTCVLPLVGRDIPIICDPYVDLEFGSGALKITPAHDPNDFEIGRAHGLPEYVMLTEDGRISDDYPAYAGMDRFEAREKIIADLEAAGLFIKKEPYKHSVGHCYRCQSAVEPYLSLQWFVRMKELAGPAMDAVKDGRTRFVPERWTKVYLDWLENIRDWCISRQLWWGHRIPVWDCGSCGTRSCSIEDIDACPKCGSKEITQQSDVLDTWFSSGLWPLSTLGWPNKTADLKTYYPTSVLVTGFDIIFFWVARMMFFGLKFGGDVPFGDVFIHGLIRDETGKKMSKSSGNAMDPMEIIDEFGADAMRFTFLYLGSMGQDVNVSTERFRIGAGFCNKLWNTARFILMMAPDAPGIAASELSSAKLDLKDRWMLSRAASVVKETTSLMETYDLNEAAQKIYDLMWRDFCDWYIELAKRPLREGDAETVGAVSAVLHHTLRRILVMLHPYIPHITEEIWSKLPGTDGTILDAGWPADDWKIDAGAEEDVALLQDVVRRIRDIRAGLNLPPSEKLPVTLITHDETGGRALLLESEARFIRDMAGAGEISVDKPLAEGVSAMSGIAGGVEIFVPVAADVLEAESARLKKNREKVLVDISKSESKLGNEQFVSNAPEEIVSREKERLAGMKGDLEKLDARIAMLGGTA